MEDAITTLRAERTALRARLAKVEAAIAEYDQWAESVAGLLGEQTPSNTLGSSEVFDAGETPPQADRNPSSIRDFENATLAVLADADRPIQRGPLLSALERAGITVGGKNPANTMATRLSRMTDITNLRGYGYWLRGRDFPPAGHEAGDLDLGPVVLKPTKDGEEDDPLFPGHAVHSKEPK